MSEPRKYVLNEVALALNEWRDAGGPVEAVAEAIVRLIENAARIGADMAQSHAEAPRVTVELADIRRDLDERFGECGTYESLRAVAYRLLDYVGSAAPAPEDTEIVCPHGLGAECSDCREFFSTTVGPWRVLGEGPWVSVVHAHGRSLVLHGIAEAIAVRDALNTVSARAVLGHGSEEP